MTPWIATLIALFVWWFATGAILLVVKHADRYGLRARRLATFAGLPMMLFGIWGYEISLTDTSVTGAYIAFLSALGIWGWIELAFLTGVISGPIQKPCPPNVPEWERFLRAWGTVAFHEILLVGALIIVPFAITLDPGKNVFPLRHQIEDCHLLEVAQTYSRALEIEPKDATAHNRRRTCRAPRGSLDVRFRGRVGGAAD